MIIAVTSETGEVFQHFGHTPEFTIYETNGDDGLDRVLADGAEHGELAHLLEDAGPGSAQLQTVGISKQR